MHRTVEYRDIAVTWPKTKPFLDYMVELQRARSQALVINYRVARLPHWSDTISDHGFTGWLYGVERPRCYMVYDGAVLGWLTVLGTCWRAAGEVEGWPAGWYIVRSPEWNALKNPVEMKSFRSWRWWKLNRPT